MGRLSINWLNKHNFAPGDVFIQTGTQNGISLKYCAPHFETIHTIELDKHYFEVSRDNLAKFENVHCHHGTSPVVLRRIIDPRIQTVAWLDAHYVASDICHSQINNQCPLLWELSAFFNCKWKASLTLLIDDAHFFQPTFWRLRRSKVYDRRQWPREKEIRSKAASFGYVMSQIDDVFVIQKPS